jgi:hypothetical protein
MSTRKNYKQMRQRGHDMMIAYKEQFNAALKNCNNQKNLK